MSKNPVQVCDCFQDVSTQQTNCLYTQYGQRIAYYQLDGNVTAFLDIDRGIYGFINFHGNVHALHTAYFQSKYELWHDTYRIGWQTIDHARKLDYPVCTRV